MALDPDEYSTYPSISGKWVGLFCTTIGLLLIGAQIYAWISVGALSWKLSGGGAAFLFVGVASLFYHFDDNRSSTPGQPEGEPEWLPLDKEE